MVARAGPSSTGGSTAATAPEAAEVPRWPAWLVFPRRGTAGAEAAAADRYCTSKQAGAAVEPPDLASADEGALRAALQALTVAR
jgi:hypothetical protein